MMNKREGRNQSWGGQQHERLPRAPLSLAPPLKQSALINPASGGITRTIFRGRRSG